jgi:hypothetical protein
MARLGTDGSRRQNGRPACLAWTRSPRDVAIKFVDALGHLRRVQPVESAWSKEEANVIRRKRISDNAQTPQTRWYSVPRCPY